MSRTYRGNFGKRIKENTINTVTHDSDTGCYYICLKDKPCIEDNVILLCQYKKDYQAFTKYFLDKNKKQSEVR